MLINQGFSMMFKQSCSFDEQMKLQDIFEKFRKQISRIVQDETEINLNFYDEPTKFCNFNFNNQNCANLTSEIVSPEKDFDEVFDKEKRRKILIKLQDLGEKFSKYLEENLDVEEVIVSQLEITYGDLFITLESRNLAVRNL